MPTNQTSAHEVERMTIAVGEALGLFPSCIKSGEDWSPTCQRVLEAARDALTRLTAAALTADREGWMRCQGEAAEWARISAKGTLTHDGRREAEFLERAISALPYSPPSHAAEPIETCGLAYEVEDCRQAKEVG